MSDQPNIQNGNQPPEESLSALRRNRLWLTLGLPLLVVAGIAVAVRLRPAPLPAPAVPVIPPATAPAQDPNEPDDTVVTNIPRIRIDPSITLTTRPPDIADAVMALEQTPSRQDAGALEAARAELEEGTLFLERKSGRVPAPSPVQPPDISAEDLSRAEESLRKDVPSTPAITNSATPK